MKNGANEGGYSDITNFTPKPGLNTGVVFYITYPKEIIRNMQNAPTQEYVEELVNLNTRLDALGMKCEEFLIDNGYSKASSMDAARKGLSRHLTGGRQSYLRMHFEYL